MIQNESILQLSDVKLYRRSQKR